MKPFLLNLLLSSLAVLAPIHAIMATVGFLIFADMALGIARAIKVGERITSRAMARTIYKMLGYQLAVISGFLIETFLIPGVGIPVSKLVAAVIASVEGKSILENVEKITGTNFFEVVKKLQVGKGDPK